MEPWDSPKPNDGQRPDDGNAQGSPPPPNQQGGYDPYAGLPPHQPYGQDPNAYPPPQGYEQQPYGQQGYYDPYAAQRIEMAKSMVKGPAMTLLILGGLWLAYIVIEAMRAVLQLAGVVGMPTQEELDPFGTAPPWMTAEVAVLMGLGVSTVLFIAAVLMLFGMFRMLQVRGFGLAMTGAIISMVPCMSPCCVIGIPFGIWALIVLLKPEVKYAFQINTASTNSPVPR